MGPVRFCVGAFTATQDAQQTHPSAEPRGQGHMTSQGFRAHPPIAGSETQLDRPTAEQSRRDGGRTSQDHEVRWIAPSEELVSTARAQCQADGMGLA